MQVSGARLTFALVLVGPVLAVDLPVAAEAQVDALPAVALELGLRADGTVLLVAAVVTLGVTVAPPRLRDAVHLARGAGELLRGAGGGLCGGGRGTRETGSQRADQDFRLLNVCFTSPPQESSSCSSTRWTGHEQRVVPSPFTMQMWVQPPLSQVHGCLPGGANSSGESGTPLWSDGRLSAGPRRKPHNHTSEEHFALFI